MSPGGLREVSTHRRQDSSTSSSGGISELFVSGSLQELDWPTLLGSTAFSRATLSNIIWLSEAARP
jgi:hypothetical protein